MLENNDQFITFSASKALVMVLISQECSVEVRNSLCHIVIESGIFN